MFSIFPHWDARIGKGQRSSHGEPTAIVFVSTDLELNGDGAYTLPPLRPYVAGSSGTVNVHSHIATAYIEKLVCRIALGQAAIWQRSTDQSTFALASVRLKESGHAGFDWPPGWG